MLASEKMKFLKLEEILTRRVVGQEEVIRAVSDAIRRNKSGLSDINKPMGMFLFLGPTGVGKTELAKTLADFLFNDEKAVTRIDMSEYMEKHTVSRLIGAPPDYVGYEEGGQLTEAVRRRPYSVVLFDEIEKAHPDVFNVLLQLLDEGRLIDGQGRIVDFKNCLIIMTSNLGGDIIQKAEKVEDVKEEISRMLKLTFKPEFMNRIDETIFFNRLGKSEIGKIVDIQLSLLQARLKERKIALELTPKAKELLADTGFDPQFGARPLKRTIQALVQNPLAKRILAGEISDGESIVADAEKGEIVFKRRAAPKAAKAVAR
jgi:ATP-dependent Clp protease ATP-binding subunit ClpB